jgi:asparagine synthase (glutamine-hydrolysing)
MCGITGILRFDGKPIERGVLTRMNDTMTVRGPDDSGYHVDRSIGLAMRRLAIIDLNGGHQPISNEDGTLHIILNGEIYNYIELRSDLEKRGHAFKTHSDVEVLLHLYEEYGSEAIHHVNGMFAFALWDSRREKLWIARDRLGIKPLVYASNGRSFVFASTLDAIIASGEFPARIDTDAFLLYLGLSYVPTPRTIYSNVHKLAPGHDLTVVNGQITVRRYWDVEEFAAKYERDLDGDFVQEVSSLLKDSIALHSRSDVPVGCFLSGGVDSSATTALFCRQSSKPVHTFCVDFVGKTESDIPYAKMVSDRYATLHHAYEMGFEKAYDELTELVPHLDEPIADSAIIPSYFLSKEARTHGIKVILTGAGGDELFGGYSRHFWGKRDIFAGRLPFLPTSLWLTLANMRCQKLVHYGLQVTDKGLSFGLATSGVHLGRLASLLRDKRMLERARELISEQFSDINAGEKRSGFTYSRMLLDLRQYLVDDVLSVSDKTSMAASVEGRVPLLDHRLAELAFAVGSKTNVAGGVGKVSLKCAVKSVLPEKILRRSKTGFNGPVTSWVGGGLKERIIKRLTAPGDAFWREFIAPAQLKAQMSDKRILPSISETVFSLLVCDLWGESHGPEGVS